MFNEAVRSSGERAPDDDDFFDPVGDSLLATSLVALVKTKLGKRASVTGAVRHPTRRLLAGLFSPLPHVVGARSV